MVFVRAWPPSVTGHILLLLVLSAFVGPGSTERICDCDDLNCPQEPDIQLTSEPQLIFSPNKDEQGLSQGGITPKICTRAIHSDPGTYVQVELLEISLRPSRSGCTDHIAIADDEGNVVMGVYCRKENTGSWFAEKELYLLGENDQNNGLRRAESIGGPGVAITDPSPKLCGGLETIVLEYDTDGVSDIGSAHFGFKVSVRAVTAKQCGLCKSVDGNSCDFSISRLDGAQQCSTDNTCVTDAGTVETCDTNDYCESECLTRDLGISCIFPFTVGEFELNGCVNSSTIESYDGEETGMVCPTAVDDVTGEYSGWAICADVGTFCDEDAIPNIEPDDEPTICDLEEPCKNGGVCFVESDGAYFCECINEWWGTNCTQHPNIELFCGATSMQIVVDAETVEELTEDGESIHLLDRSCDFNFNGTHYVLETSYQECGTLLSMEVKSEVQSSTVLFCQEIKASTADALYLSGMNAVLVCELTATGTVSLGVQPSVSNQLVADPFRIDVFPLSIQYYRTAALLDSLESTDSTTPPIIYDTNVPVYMSVRTESFHEDAQLVLDACWSTKDRNPTTLERYPLMTDRCQVDSTFNIVRVDPAEVFFNFMSFRFANEPSYSFLSYIHCSAYICHASQPGCNQTATHCSGSSRRRRSLDSQDDFKRSKTMVASMGPIIHLQSDPSDHSSPVAALRSYRGPPPPQAARRRTFESNWQNALGVYRSYMTENLAFLAVVMVVVMAVLALLFPLGGRVGLRADEIQHIAPFKYARYLAVV